MITYYSINETTREFMKEESISKAPKETGGLLIGHFEDDCVFIQHATGPGPKAIHARNKFKRDGQYSQVSLNSAIIELGGSYDYIGEWHSHPQNIGPSSLDLSSIEWIANNNDYKVSTPVLGLCIRGKRDFWYFVFFVYFDGKLTGLQTR